MDTKVKKSFWLDEDIGGLPPDLKLVALWILTNPQVNILGLTKVSPRSFVFDTGLTIEALGRACQALPRAFIYRDGFVLARRFVTHQFGGGDSLRRSNLFKSLLSAFGELKEGWIRAELAEANPVLMLPPLDSKWVKPTSPPKPLEGQREGEGEISSSEGSLRGPADMEVFKFADGWPGEPASGLPPVPREYAEQFCAEMAGRVVGWPRDWQRALIARWRKAHRAGWPNSAFSASFGGYKKNAARTGDAEEWWTMELSSLSGRIVAASLGKLPALERLKEIYKARGGT